MRKLLVAVAVAALAIAVGPPAMAQADTTTQPYQHESIVDVLSPTDGAFTARAVYHPSDSKVLPLQVTDKSAGKKRDGSKGDKEASAQRRAAVPLRYPLLL